MPNNGEGGRTTRTGNGNKRQIYVDAQDICLERIWNENGRKMQVEKLAGNQVMAGLGRWESRLDLGPVWTWLYLPLTIRI